MTIAVLNGSPKGLTSVTMQYVLFLQKNYPAHRMRILNVCHDVHKLEEDAGAFEEVISTIRESDVVLFATPVYILLVPGPYKRFIELVFERGAQSAFAGKYAGVITTSVRFFDHAAHRYLNAVCDDLDMRYVGAHSADMFDLLHEPHRRALCFFHEQLLHAAEHRLPAQKRHVPLACDSTVYVPQSAPRKISAGGHKVVILVDADESDVNLPRMAARLRDCFADPVEMIDLRDIRMRGGCLGCIRCSFDGVCVYRDADDVCDTYRKLEAADIVVEAVRIKDRFLSARWKTFRDRAFFNNHIPKRAGKQLAYLVSGPLAQIPNLRDVLEASAELGQLNLAGIVTDESPDSACIDALIDDLARRMVACAQARHVPPPTFLGKGGHKILRDEIWAGLRSVFPRDHRYYRRHGLYDFPRRSLKTRVTDFFFGLMMRIPSVRKRFQSQMREGMIRPLVKMLEAMDQPAE